MGRKKIEDLHVSKRKTNQLKIYCKHYKEWVELLNEIEYYPNQTVSSDKIKSLTIANPTASIAELKEVLIKNIYVIEKASVLTDPNYGELIFKAVTEGWGYDRLKKECDVKISKPTYYRLYRRFFWILDKSRNLQMLE